MGLFFFRFWPVLIPLAIYRFWLFTVARRARKAGKPVPRFSDGPWYWAVSASLLVGFGCFLLLAAGTEERKGAYIPPHMERGVLVPGIVKDAP